MLLLSHDRSSCLNGNNVRDQLHLKVLRGVDLNKKSHLGKWVMGGSCYALLSTLAGVRSRQRGILSGFGYESLLACRNLFLNKDKNENQAGIPQSSCPVVPLLPVHVNTSVCGMVPAHLLHLRVSVVNLLLFSAENPFMYPLKYHY